MQHPKVQTPIRDRDQVVAAVRKSLERAKSLKMTAAEWNEEAGKILKLIESAFIIIYADGYIAATTALIAAEMCQFTYVSAEGVLMSVSEYTLATAAMRKGAHHVLVWKGTDRPFTVPIAVEEF